MYIIMTDTSANLEPADLKKLEIEDLPLTYMVDGKSPLDSGDAAFDGPAFYAAMRGGAKVVTSQVTPQTYIDAMTPFLKEGKDVLFIGMSSGISGSYNSAQIAANQLREEFPACKIYTIDTLSASLGVVSILFSLSSVHISVVPPVFGKVIFRARPPQPPAPPAKGRGAGPAFIMQDRGCGVK